MAHTDGWPALFSSAFRQSRNAMLLVDEQRRVVDVNAACLRLVGDGRDALVGHPLWTLIVGGPLATESEWRAQMATRRFTGEATLHHAGGGGVAVQWGATTEKVTGQRLVLFVALSTSRWGGRFRRTPDAD